MICYVWAIVNSHYIFSSIDKMLQSWALTQKGLYRLHDVLCQSKRYFIYVEFIIFLILKKNCNAEVRCIKPVLVSLAVTLKR
jgi:hypothetical protein